MRVSVVVPTFNEEGNVSQLVARLDRALGGVDAEIVFVDDSTDDTARQVREAALAASAPVSVWHRDEPAGGLSGAVVAGIARARGDWVVVMDGDLQHPPEQVPGLLAAAGDGVDVVVASRYRDGGSSDGLATPARALVSRGATALARVLLTERLAGCSDPMSGFFAVRRSALDLAVLRPRGFKILLELLGRHRLRVAEIPLVFGTRVSGVSKADARQGLQYLWQLALLWPARPVDAESGAIIEAGAAPKAGVPQLRDSAPSGDRVGAR